MWSQILTVTQSTENCPEIWMIILIKNIARKKLNTSQRKCIAIRALTLFSNVFEWSKTFLFSSAIQSTKDTHSKFSSPIPQLILLSEKSILIITSHIRWNVVGGPSLETGRHCIMSTQKVGFPAWCLKSKAKEKKRETWESDRTSWKEDRGWWKRDGGGEALRVDVITEHCIQAWCV